MGKKGRYSSFDHLNGDHPLKRETLNSFVEYSVRTRSKGKVWFFHFDLAKEMGLIPLNHKEELNEELERKILNTFGIVIINEFDHLKNRKFPKEDIRPFKYMATRYLQLQHPSRQGKTSGDGRSIWNGCVRHKNTTFDISSCGTGATGLSPATAIEQKFFETGEPFVSYGCGYSELDEGVSTLFFSEVFHQNKISNREGFGHYFLWEGVGCYGERAPQSYSPGAYVQPFKAGKLQGLKGHGGLLHSSPGDKWRVERPSKRGIFPLPLFFRQANFGFCPCGGQI